MIPFPVYISTPGIELPRTRLSNDEQLARVRANFRGDEREWRRIEKRLRFVFHLCGSDERYIEANHEIPMADYAVAAARDALDGAGVDPADVDMLINGSIARDYFEPATAMEVAAKLGLPRVSHVFDVTCACAGLLQAVHTAVAYMSLYDDVRNVVVCAADLTKGRISYDIQDREQVALRAAGLTIGECASAFVLSRDPLASGGRLRAVRTESMPEYFHLCQAPVHATFTSNSAELFRLNQFVPDHVRRTLAEACLEPTEVDHWVCHQPSESIVLKVLTELGVDTDRAPLTHRHYGNSINSTVPVTLHHLLGERAVERGQTMLWHSAAAGFQMVSAVVEWCVASSPARAADVAPAREEVA